MKPGTARRIAQYSSIIFLLPASLLIGFFGGQWLDEWLGTDPVFVVVCVLLGAAAGFYQVFKILLEK